MRNRNLTLLILFLTALGVKLLIFFAITELFIFVKYPYFAQKISEGADIGERLLDLSPLYLYINLFSYKIYGESWEALALLQAIVGSFTVVLTYLIGEKLLGKSVALLSAILLILYGNLTLFELTLEPEAWVLFLNALLVLLLIRARDPALNPSPWRWLSIGALLGLSIIAKPNALLLVPVTLIWVWWNPGQRSLKAKASLLLLVGAALLVSPVTIRNYARFHDFVLVTADGGKVFYHGNGPGATGMERADLPGQGFSEEGQGDPDHAHALFRQTARSLRGPTLTPSACSSFWVSQTIEYMRHYPGASLSLLWKKLLYFWGNYEVHDIDSNYKSYVLLQGWPFLPFGFISALAIVGMILGWKKFPRLFLLFAMVATYWLSAIIFFAASRYRLPAVPYLTIFAAGTLLFLYQRWGKRALGQLGLCLVAVIAIFIGSQWLFQKEIQDLDHWQKATRLHYSMGGNFFFKQGLYQKAIPELEKAIQLAPGFAPAYNRLGMCYANLNDFPKAEQAFRKVIELAPQMDQGYLHLGLLHHLKGDAEKAVPLLEKALRLNPNNEKARRVLADIHSKS